MSIGMLAHQERRPWTSGYSWGSTFQHTAPPPRRDEVLIHEPFVERQCRRITTRTLLNVLVQPLRRSSSSDFIKYNMEVILKKIYALCTVNLEIIQRIKARATNDESLFASVISFVRQERPKVIKRVKGSPVTLMYGVAIEEVYEYYQLDDWCPNLAFVPILDCKSFGDLERLSAALQRVVPKYVLFGNNEKVLLEMEKFKDIVERIQCSLGALETRIADELPKTSEYMPNLQKMNNNIQRVAKQLGNLNDKLQVLSIGNHKRAYMYNEHELQERIRKQEAENQELKNQMKQMEEKHRRV